jgi:putative tryptophan/tyrosine transport system substrate-binding protein
MDRRRFLLTSLAGALAAPLVGEAQQVGRVYRLGFLQPQANTRDVNFREVFSQGLRDHGYIEGQNIFIEYRMSKASTENPALLTDLLGRKIDILVTWTTPALMAAKQATSTIPIVGISGDPVQTGLIASIARPGGNLTGFAILSDELELKNLQLLKEAAPRISRVAIFSNPDNPVWSNVLKRLQEVAPALGVKLQPLEVRESCDLEVAFAAAAKERAEALLVFRDAIFADLRRQITDFAARHRLPAISGERLFVEAGALMMYRANFPLMLRRAATYVDKILKGAKPADLPVEQPTKFELVINVKTAKALGLTIPPSLLARADQVIE